ncbi:hypothetical protein HY990_03250 [Candidatus Micrarchaeota archaeon]|nr:hypothetical protein [Candidatus Micrarchaeota archaeon]
MEDKGTVKKNNSLIYISIAAFVIIVLVAAVVYMPQLDKVKFTIYEQPLIKNKELQIKNGQIFQYVFIYNKSTPLPITYGVYSKSQCTAIRIFGSSNNSDEICIRKDGTEQNGSNTTYSNPSIIMFKPWMLALKDNWKWEANITMEYPTVTDEISRINYRVVRKEPYRGRMAYFVEESIDGANPEYEWIDQDFRILLKMQGPEYTIELVNATGIRFND